MSARRVPIAPYFKVDFALQEGEDSGAFIAWTDILDQRLIAKLETVEKVHAVGEGVVITALIKECRGLAACIRELHRTRHKLMQVIRGEEIRVRSKVSAHRRRKRGHRKETTPAN